MYNTLGDIKNDVLVKLGGDTTIAFYTDTILNTWINGAYTFAASYKKWPFTERRDNTQTWSSSTEEYSYPSDFKADSIRILQVGGKRLQKLNFEDYQIFREEESDSADKVFSDFGRTYFINPNIDTSGTVTVWGQYQIAALDGTDPSATTVFSGREEEGNEAIIEEVLSYAKLKEKKFQEANAHHQRAVFILEGIWDRVQAEQFGYHTHKARGGMFKRIDVLEGAVEDELLKRDQFY